MSQILNCGLDQRTLSILASLVENGVNPEALAAVVKELKRESDALKVSLMLTCRRHKARELIIIKMLKTTFIARASDGLILCETYDIDTNPQSKSLLISQLND
jgi:mitotic-spindle organizing protein 1